MSSIIKKGTNACSFRLKNQKLIVLEPNILTVFDESDFNALMQEYGSFIEPRIITEANPAGCFIVHYKEAYVEDMSAEVGEVKDNSAQIEVNEGIVSEAPVKKKRAYKRKNK